MSAVRKDRNRGSEVERAEREVRERTRDFERAVERLERRLELTGATIQGVIELFRHPGSTMRLLAREASAPKQPARRARKAPKKAKVIRIARARGKGAVKRKRAA